MASWVRRRATVRELECGSCNDLIPLGALYFLAVNGCKFCSDCEPENEEETACRREVLADE